MDIKTKHILYYDNSHLSVLLRRNGSVFPLVAPYAMINVLLTFGIYYAKHEGYDLSFSDKGHGFMAIMISFLVVTRSQIVYGRFMEARERVGHALRNGREIVNHTSVLTSDRKDKDAKEWRCKVRECNERENIKTNTCLLQFEFTIFFFFSFYLDEIDCISNHNSITDNNESSSSKLLG